MPDVPARDYGDFTLGSSASGVRHILPTGNFAIGETPEGYAVSPAHVTSAARERNSGRPPVGGRPLLAWIVERQATLTADQVDLTVATSVELAPYRSVAALTVATRALA